MRMRMRVKVRADEAVERSLVVIRSSPLIPLQRGKRVYPFERVSPVELVSPLNVSTPLEGD